MYDTKVKALYNEDIKNSVTISGTLSSDGTFKKYFKEQVSFPIGDKEGSKATVNIVPASVQNISTNASVVKFVMPDVNVSVATVWESIYMEIEDTAGGVSTTNYFRNMTADNPVDLVIPSEINGIRVHYICGSAFARCKALKSVNITGSANSLGQFAFEDCTSLESVFINSGLTDIEGYAFSNCSKMVDIHIPDTVTTIGPGAFKNCSSLRIINIPDTVTSIGESVFSSCTSLLSPRLPRRILSLPDELFTGCTFDHIYIPKNITSMSPNTFRWFYGVIYVDKSENTITGAPWNGTNVVWRHEEYFDIDDTGAVRPSVTFLMLSPMPTHLLIPDSINGKKVTGIQSSAFNYMNRLESVYIPDTVTTLGEHSAFEYCSKLPSINIPSSVTTIGEYTFASCTNLSSININKKKDSIKGAPWGAPSTTKINWLG